MQTKAPTGDAQTTDTTEATTTDTVATTLATAATTTLEADTATPTTSQEPMSQAGVFSFAEHDLCEWITPDEIAEFVAAGHDWLGHPCGGFGSLIRDG